MATVLLYATWLEAAESAPSGYGRALQQSAPEEGAPRPPLPQQKLIKTKSRCDEERSGQMIGPGCRPVCEETCRDYHKGCRCKRTGSKCFRHFCADDPKAKELHTRFCICKCNGCRSWPRPVPGASFGSGPARNVMVRPRKVSAHGGCSICSAQVPGVSFPC
eukprot:jgi/Tetstr1/431117/TSEL_020832.t1